MLDSIQKMNPSENSYYDNNYHEDYMRLYIVNVVLTQQLKELLKEKNDILVKLMKFEAPRAEESKKQQLMSSDMSVIDMDESVEARRIRLRRTASEIYRHYKCPVKVCQKSYGSEGSLNQHMKLKHPEVFHEHSSQEIRKSLRR